MERPILFSSEMVRAILDGRKTQTRRVIKDDVDYYVGSGNNHFVTPSGQVKLCPYGQIGDLLWVRETWADISQTAPGNLHYRANATEGDENWFKENGWHWRPSIFMPRWASRITLKITNVRVERLWEITGKDCLAEGVTKRPNGEDWLGTDFSILWDSINAKRGYPWDSNPWVWVIEFERRER